MLINIWNDNQKADNDISLNELVENDVILANVYIVHEKCINKYNFHLKNNCIKQHYSKFYSYLDISFFYDFSIDNTLSCIIKQNHKKIYHLESSMILSGDTIFKNNL